MATDYYVSNRGNDSNPGTSAARPWKSLLKVQKEIVRMRPGDRLLLERGGLFAGSLKLDNIHGREGAPITISSYGSGAEPVVTGAVRVGDWIRHAGNIWKVRCVGCPSSLRAVYVDDEPIPMGRYPNADASNKGYLTMDETAKDNKTIVDKELSQKFSSNYWRQAEVVVRTKRWILDVAPIASHSGSVIKLSKAITYAAQKGYGYFLQNSYQTLDQDKEWFYDPATSMLYVYFDAINPNEHVTEVASRPVLLNITSSSFITIENIRFEKSRSETIKVYGSKHVSFTGNQILNAGKNAVLARLCDQFTFQNNVVDHTANNAIEYRGNHGRFVDNKVYNTAMVAGMGVSGNSQYKAVHLNGNNILCQYNEVVNAGYLGIQFNGNTNEIKNNLVSHVCMVKDDGAGIYTFDNQGSNNQVVDNIVLYAIGVGEGTDKPYYNTARGLYTDGGTSGVYIKGNTVAYCGGGIMLHVSRNITALDNTLFANSDHTLKIVYHPFTGRPETRNLSIKNNIFYSGDIDRAPYHVASYTKSVREFGVIDENILVNPVQDVYPRATYAMLLEGNTRYPVGSYMAKSFITYENMRLTPYGNRDREAPVFYPKYLVTDTLSDNLLRNSDLNQKLTLKDWIKSSNNSSTFNIANDYSNTIEGPTLKASFSTNKPDQKGNIIQREFPLKNGAYYQISFDVKGSKKFVLPFTVDTWGGNEVHATKYFDVDTQVKRYVYIFKAKSNTDKGRINFNLSSENGPTWFDNIELRSVEVKETKERDVVQLEFNASNKTKDIVLDGHYVSVTGEKLSGKISLPPYRSVILIKDLAPIEEPDNETPKPPATVPAFTSIGKLPWKEHFTLANKAVEHQGATAWKIDTADISKESKYGVEQGMLRFSKADKPIVWKSHAIDISGVASATVRYNLKEMGNIENQEGGQGHLYFYYRVDSGALRPIHLQDGNLIKDDTWYTFSADSITGGFLELVIKGKTNKEVESYFVDYITVEAENEPSKDEEEEEQDKVEEEEGEDIDVDVDQKNNEDGNVNEDQDDGEDEEEENKIGSLIRIFAAGKSGIEEMELLVDEEPVKKWRGISGNLEEREFVQYVYTLSRKIEDPSRIRVAYTNDIDASTDLKVDKMILDGVVYETEAANTFSTGTNHNGSCEPGYKESEELHCSGYFQYAPRDTDVMGIDAEHKDPVAADESMTVLVYPNPFANSINVSISGDNTTQVALKLVDVMGHTLYQTDQVPIYRSMKLEVASLKAGVYLLLIQGENDNFQSFRVIKK